MSVLTQFAFGLERHPFSYLFHLFISLCLYFDLFIDLNNFGIYLFIYLLFFSSRRRGTTPGDRQVLGCLSL